MALRHPIIRTVVFVASLAVFVLSAAPSAFSEEEKGLFKEGAPVEISADYLSYDKETGAYRAKGSVVIVQGSTTVTAAEAVLDSAAGKASASGGVVMADGTGRTVSAESISMDLKENTAIVARGRLFYPKDKVTVSGEVIRKTGQGAYEFEGARFTTCDCPEGETPPWSFGAKTAEVRTGDAITGRNAYFYVKDAPVLYSPYVSIPITRERQSGFLLPKPRYSELRGFALENAFYWAISRSADATFYLDVETRRGLGEGAEYRYVRSARSDGEFYAYHYKERDIGRVRSFKPVDNLSRPQSAGDDRWRLKFRHTELLPGGVALRADVNAVSDDEYFLDFGKGAYRSLESLESSLSATKDWSNASLTANWRVFDNLMSADDSALFRKLPEVTFMAPSSRLFGGPLYFSMESSYVNFARGAGYDGHRLDARPRVSLTLSPGGWFDFTPSIGPRATLYAVDGDGPGGAFSDRYLYDVKADLATSLVRIYASGDGGVMRRRHVVRPSISYEYVPEVDQAGLPSFDPADRVAKRNALTYSLYSALSGWEEGTAAGAASDYLRFEMRQSYDFNEASRALASSTDERRPFSDVTLEFDAAPSPLTRANARARYNVYDNRFTSQDLSFKLANERGDSVGASYRFLRDINRYAEVLATARLTPSVSITYINRYSFDQKKSLETTYGAGYSSQCWGVDFTYSDRLDERVVMANFTLRGIGKIAGVQTALENR